MIIMESENFILKTNAAQKKVKICRRKDKITYGILNKKFINSWLHTLADPKGGGCGGCNPLLNFQKKTGVTSVAVVISTVSTVSELERNGQGRRDVGKSVHVRQAIMQLDAIM